MASDNLQCGSPLFPPRPPSGVPRILPPSHPPVFPKVPVLTVNGEGPDRSGNVVVELPDLGGKADKVASPTDGNFAGLDGSGNLVDSGKKASDFQPRLTFDDTPTEGSQNPVTSDGIKRAIDAATPADYDQVKAQVEENAEDIAGIEAVIPNQASAQNQLADKGFVNSSIATNTATFRGTYNLVSDLSLAVAATEQQVAAAIAAKLVSLVPPVDPENNDYCFVQVPYDEDPVDPEHIERIDRYKCTVAESGGATTRTWGYEFSLNNSSFTAAQWAAINSGITAADVAKIANAATKADATLTPIYSQTPTFSEWTISPRDTPFYEVIWYGETTPPRWAFNSDSYPLDTENTDPNATSIEAQDSGEHGVGLMTATRVRTDIIGYTLGSQTNQPLASVAEAEALRGDKLDKSAVVALSSSATAGQAADAKSTGDALEGKLGNSGDQTLSGLLTADGFRVVGGNKPITLLSDAGGQAFFQYNGKNICFQEISGTLALLSDIPYAIHAATVSSGMMPTVTDILPRATNTATLGSTVTSATVTLPAATAGKMRDFFIALTVEGSTAPSLTWIDPATQTDADIAVGEDSLADIDTGLNIILFSEAAGQNRWIVSVKHEEAAS